MSTLKRLDFSADRGVPWWEWALLLVGLTCLGLALVQWREARNEVARLEALQRRPSVAGPAADGVESNPDHVLASKIRPMLQVEWQRLFTALEAKLPVGIALLTVDPDVTAGTVRITGQATTLPALAEYLRHLESVGLDRPRLLSHQPLDPGAPSGAVRFSASALWRRDGI